MASIPWSPFTFFEIIPTNLISTTVLRQIQTIPPTDDVRQCESMARSNLLVHVLRFFKDKLYLSRTEDENSQEFPCSKKPFAIGDSRMNSADERTFFHGTRNFRDKEQRKRKASEKGLPTM